MTRLLFVRHGETEWNEGERIQGQQDVPLNEHGRKQAVALGERLRGTRIDACFASPLKRAKETAQLILQAAGVSLPITPLPELTERGFGAWEKMWVNELKAIDEFKRWLAELSLPAPPDGESVAELCERVRKGLNAIIKAVGDGTALVVSHAGPIKAAMCVLLGLPLESYARWHIDNAGLTVVDWHEGKVWLVSSNDTCHCHGVQ